jgi:hypothetical protein
MAAGRAGSLWFTSVFTEDWLAVVVGLILVGLVLSGILKNIP